MALDRPSETTLRHAVGPASTAPPRHRLDQPAGRRAPTSRCCARRRPGWRPDSTSPSTTSRTCGSPWTRRARCCSPRRRPPRRWTARSRCCRTTIEGLRERHHHRRPASPPATPSPGPCCPRWPGRSTAASTPTTGSPSSCRSSARSTATFHDRHDHRASDPARVRGLRVAAADRQRHVGCRS